MSLNPSAPVETRSRPRLLAVTRHGFTFYVAAPVSSIRERAVESVKSCGAWICSMMVNVEPDDLLPTRLYCSYILTLSHILPL